MAGGAVLLAAVTLAAQAGAPHSVMASAAPPAPTGRPVARVNGAVLTDRDLLREMYAIFPYARQHNGGFPKPMEADIRAGALKMIEFEELVYQEAQQRKMTISPDRLNRAEREFRQQFHTPDQYSTYLAAECKGSVQVLRSRIRRSLLIDDLLNTEVTTRAKVSVSEAEAYYQHNTERFRLPELFAVQTISVYVPKNATAQQAREARRRADDVLKQARSTHSYEEFGALAERASDDDYRVVMGDHRQVDPSKLPLQVVAALRRMQPGQISDLIQVEDVYTVVRLNQHDSPRLQTFEQVKDSLQQMLQRKKTEELRSELNARLRRNARVEEL
ncbi:MAG: peptidyl-prolyl cis-trans isomerase [Acidobacteria bacterium]|nr:peptidyl-prolyl cis-trans isomerase [Acidobacteriota bacterium]